MEAVFLRRALRQAVQILTFWDRPSMTTVFFWTLALKVRDVLGARRSQRPECWCRIFRP
jgi:hypothetical protein